MSSVDDSEVKEVESARLTKGFAAYLGSSMVAGFERTSILDAIWRESLPSPIIRAFNHLVLHNDDEMLYPYWSTFGLGSASHVSTASITANALMLNQDIRYARAHMNKGGFINLNAFCPSNIIAEKVKTHLTVDCWLSESAYQVIVDVHCEEHLFPVEACEFLHETVARECARRIATQNPNMRFYSQNFFVDSARRFHIADPKNISNLYLIEIWPWEHISSVVERESTHLELTEEHRSQLFDFLTQNLQSDHEFNRQREYLLRKEHNV